MTTLALLLAAAVSAAAPDTDPPAFYAGNGELHAYLIEAADNHPALHVMHEEWLAALERVPQATSLDDPMLTYGQFLQSEMGRFRVMLEQRFPWFGTLRARGEKAALEADAALARLYAERNRLFAEVKRAYADYAFLAQSITVARAQLDLLDYMEDTVRSKYALGLAAQDELLRTQIERTSTQDRLDGLLQMRPALSARLCETLGRPLVDDLPWPMPMELPPAPPDAETLYARLRAANPELRAIERVADSRGVAVDLARKKGYPDVAVGLEYVSLSKPRKMRPDRVAPGTLMAGWRTLSTLGGAMPFRPVDVGLDAYELATAREPMNRSDGGDDDIMLTLSFNVPIWRNRVRAGIAEARHMENAARHERRRAALSLESAARMTLFEFEDGMRRFRLYRDNLQPQAEMTYESLQGAYAGGITGAGFLDVLESIRTLLDFGLEQARAARDAHVAAAELEYLVGAPWAQDQGHAPERGE